jgi:hypothetical protein
MLVRKYHWCTYANYTFTVYGNEVHITPPLHEADQMSSVRLATRKGMRFRSEQEMVSRSYLN